MNDENNHQKQPFRVATAKIDARELIQEQANEISHLRQENNQLRNTVDELTNSVAMLKELVQQLRDEIASLKGQKPKPKIPPSKLEGSRGNGQDGRKNPDGKPGQPRGKPRTKKTLLEIHNNPIIEVINIPENAVFKGYKRYAVQDIIFKSHNTQYWIARWRLPDGSYISGELPKGIHGHYGPELVAYILHQAYVCRVTENLLLQDLIARGVLISAGQLNNLIIEKKKAFREEVRELLPAGLEAENQVGVDDTGGRHKGKNQYTTIIGNRWFSVFATTNSKSRINFLKLLQGKKNEYLINEDTIEYLRGMTTPNYLPGYVAFSLGEEFNTSEEWEQFLKERNIIQDAAVRFVTEAALYASVIRHGIPRDLGVHSDDAGQFDVFVHSLCWVHEERHYRKLIMTTDQAKADMERVRDQIWTIYKDLKTYKENPKESLVQVIERQFDEIFQQTTTSFSLNHQLKKTCEKKQELLKVLQRPETPLHNNTCETDARSAKIKLKISGGTRSDLGKEVRDIFLSLKQTCLKLKINFIAFLQDRVRGLYVIPKLADVIRQRAAQSSGPPN